MPQIGFTSKQSPVYHRFNALRRAYEDANGGGRVYNPDFLSVLMDAWEQRVTYTPYTDEELGKIAVSPHTKSVKKQSETK